MEEKLLEIKDLSVEYTTDEDIVKAVNHVSLTLNKGETIGLVGETGAGKTTLALSLMRLLPKVSGRITGGEIMFNGEDLVKAAEEDMRKVRGEKISMIFQDPMTSLNPVLTVEDQIQEVLQFHNHNGLCRAEMGKKVEEMLELVGIPAARKTCYPHEFSGGMKRRVAILRAILAPTDIILMDEPFTGLDADTRQLTIDLVKELCAGKLLIIATHAEDDAELLGAKIIHL